MSNIAIIPARGGSKRIPLKNIKSFLGKPIISYSINAALKSKLFDEIIVSTDNDEIAEIAIKFGAKVPFFRSKKNSSDFATTFRNNPDSMQRLSLTNTGGYDYNAKETYRAELGAIGGITDARSLAKLLTPLAQNNEKLLSRDTVSKLSKSNIKTSIDSMLLFPTNFSNGFMLNMDNTKNFEPSSRISSRKKTNYKL